LVHDLLCAAPQGRHKIERLEHPARVRGAQKPIVGQVQSGG
jgi:hypothetical protein